MAEGDDAGVALACDVKRAGAQGKRELGKRGQEEPGKRGHAGTKARESEDARK